MASSYSRSPNLKAAPRRCVKEIGGALSRVLWFRSLAKGWQQEWERERKKGERGANAGHRAWMAKGQKSGCGCGAQPQRQKRHPLLLPGRASASEHFHCALWNEKRESEFWERYYRCVYGDRRENAVCLRGGGLLGVLERICLTC